MEVSDFASERGIEIKPDFVWWVPFTLHKRDIIIAAVNARKKRVSHKSKRLNLKLAFDVMSYCEYNTIKYTKARTLDH